MTLGKRQSLAAPEDLSTISLGDATISTYRGEDDALDQDDDDNVNDFDDRTVGPGAWSEDSYAEMSEEKKNEEEDEDRELSGHGSVMIPAGLRLTMNQGTKKMDKRETGKRKTSNSSDDGRQSSSDDSTGPGSALRRKFGNDNFCHKSSRSSSKPRALSSHTALSGSGRAQPASATYDKARATIEYRIRQKALEQSSDYFLDVVLNLCRDPLKDNTSLPELKARLSAIQDEAEDVRQLQYSIRMSKRSDRNNDKFVPVRGRRQYEGIEFWPPWQTHENYVKAAKRERVRLAKLDPISDQEEV